MKSKTRDFAAGFFAVVIALLAACGGGGGSTGGVPPTNPPPPTATPCPANYTGTPPNCTYNGPVSATGQVVDHDTGNPLAGIAVGLAPWVAGATPVPQPTTDANGNFTVNASTGGQYLLVIGSNSPNDPNNRATIHQAVDLTAPATVLVAPTLSPYPSATPSAVEQSGKFRLLTLNATEQACLGIYQQARTNHSQPLVVVDEWLAEDVRLAIESATNTGVFFTPSGFTEYNSADGGGCQNDANGDYALNDLVANSALIWFGTDEISATHVGAAEGMFDPRAPLPTPTPLHQWP
jgi:hypothetical protein